MSDVPQSDELSARLRVLEDENEIRRTLVRYGFAVDAGDPDATAALYTADALVHLDSGRLTLRGRDEIRAMVLSEEHQAVLPRSTHMVGPFVVSVNGDSAVAAGYSRLDVAEQGGVRTVRTSANRWRLVREGSTWLICERDTRLIGDSSAQDLLRAGLEPAAL